jgi:flagellar hook-associated protein 2
MSTITSLGIGSGLDINTLVSQLVKAEGDPATARLDTQQQDASADLSALGALKSALSSLKSSLTGLTDLTDFQGTKVSSSNEDLFTVSSTSEASVGQYQVEVVRLAQRHKLASDSFTSTQTFGGSAGDQLVIGAGGKSFTLDLSTGKTLSELRDAINDATDNPGITASLVKVDSTHQVLTLNAADAGSANAISVTETLASSASLSFDMANLDAAGTALASTALLDSEVRVDGTTITRSGNSLTDVIDGVTINLKKAESGTRATLNVSQDLTSVSANVAAFVSQYNAFASTLTALSGFRGVGATQPALFGDAGAQSISSQLRIAVGRSVTGLDGAFSNLSQIGITMGSDGKLTLDSTKLNTALTTDLKGVGELFASTNGIATGMNGLIDTYVKSGGTLDSRSQGVQGRLDRISTSRDELDRRLTALEARYKKQFTAMDTLVGQLQSTSSYLSAQFTAMSSQTKSSS